MSAADEACGLAINLARNAGYAVFPCHIDKTPACQHGFRDASVDPAAIVQLWRRYPGPLVGVATGRASGIDLLDIDCGDWPADAKPATIEKHESARAWWHDNYRRLPQTLAFRSRSRGLHLYFAHSDTVTSPRRGSPKESILVPEAAIVFGGSPTVANA
jgi:hypothetical protein